MLKKKQKKHPLIQSTPLETSRARAKALLPGIYHAEMLSVKAKANGQIEMVFNIPEKNKQIKSDTIPAAGTEKYFVLCHKLSTYTTIEADNKHHASNKATKLFGPNWDTIWDHYPVLYRGYNFVTVAQFNELLRTLPS